MPGTLPSNNYELDQDDRIRAVSASWLDFARHNGAADLERETVVGRPIWDFVAGTDTQGVYEAIFTRVRATGRTLRLPFRCDSPDRRRYMQLTVRPRPAGGLAISASLVREEERDPISLLDRNTARSHVLVPMCSWCKAVRGTTGEWLEVEEAVAQFELLASLPLPRLTHTICPKCAASLEDNVVHHNAVS